MRKVLITGTAGFIGYHLAELLLAEGWLVHGFDAFTDYYDVSLKQARHAASPAPTPSPPPRPASRTWRR